MPEQEQAPDAPLVAFEPDTAAAILTDWPVATFTAPNGAKMGVRCVRIEDEPKIEAILGFRTRELQDRLGEISNHQVARIISLALVEQHGSDWQPAPPDAALRWPLASHRLLQAVLAAFFQAASVGARR